MDPVTEVTVSIGLQATGLSLEVTYRCAAQPHRFQYVSARQLQPQEAQDAVLASLDALWPGQRPPAVPGQTALFGPLA